MPKYNLPPGYGFFESYARTIKLVKQPLEVMAYSFNRFGDSYSVYAGAGTKTIMTRNAEFINHVLQKQHRSYQKSRLSTEMLAKYAGHGLLTTVGEYWLRQRRLIQPGFHVQKIKALYEIIDKTVDKFLEDFPTKENMDIYPLMHRAAFQIVVDSLFDIDIEEEKFNELATIISEAQTFVVKEIRQPHLNWWFRLKGQERYHLERSAQAREIIKGIIKGRRESNEEFNDLLDMLLNTRYEDTGEPMTDDQLVDEIFILIIAGHETTANALAWTLYLLANNPEIQEELRSSTSSLSIEETVKSSELSCTVQESMRLYPPAWITDRIALEDDEFQDYKFPKGSTVITVFREAHRDPRIWKDPEKFDPSRFEKKNFTKEQSKAYYPFGAGPRLCIGNNFAMAEMAIFMQKFVQKFKVIATGQVPKEIPLITLRPDKILLSVEKV
ncbi:MAG: cytochrome P450 [bacterium]|nr:cytochrome P450 [bacterium]